MTSQYRRADNEVAFDKFSSTATFIVCPKCEESMMGFKWVIFWRDEYWHLECAFQKTLSELEQLKAEQLAND